MSGPDRLAIAAAAAALRDRWDVTQRVAVGPPQADRQWVCCEVAETVLRGLSDAGWTVTRDVAVESTRRTA